MQSQGQLRFRTVIRGWQRDRYIMMDWPSDEQKLSLLRPDKPCVIQFFNRGRAGAFSTLVTDLGTSRQPCFRVEWPKRIELVAIRQHERAPVNVPCRITIGSAGPADCILKDISAGGCGVHVTTPLEKGAEVTLQFSLNKVTAFEGLEAVVRSKVPVSDGVVLGLQFANLSEVVADQLELFVAMALGQLRSLTASTQRILVLENSGQGASSIRDRLEQDGYEVTTSANIVDGFYQLKLLVPDLLILHQDLPELSGDAVCNLIHNTVGCVSLPMLIMGKPDDGAKSRAEAAGAKGYFSDANALVDEAIRLLNEALPAAQTPASGDAAAPASGPNGKAPAESEEAQASQPSEAE